MQQPLLWCSIWCGGAEISTAVGSGGLVPRVNVPCNPFKCLGAMSANSSDFLKPVAGAPFSVNHRRPSHDGECLCLQNNVCVAPPTHSACSEHLFYSDTRWTAVLSCRTLRTHADDESPAVGMFVLVNRNIISDQSTDDDPIFVGSFCICDYISIELL